MSGVAFLGRALRHRNYRLFFCGQLVSLIGTWMTTTATSWLVYRLTGSGLLLGVVGFASQFPAFLLSPVAGIYVDRWDQRRLLVATQTLAMAQSLLLAALTFSGRVNMGWVIALSVAQGLINAFDMPCRQAFVVTMIEDRRDLSNAIALNSTMFNASRIVGPAVSGLLITASNEAWCFLLDGLSYLAVIAALLSMVIKVHPKRADERVSVVGQLREGWQAVADFLPIRSILILLTLMSFAGVPYNVLAPLVAGRILHGGPHTLGFLMTASGAGALLSALWLASRSSVLGLGGMIPAAAFGFGLGLAGLAVSRSPALSMASLVLVGAGVVLMFASSNTIMQTIVDDDKRGRTMSFFAMSFLGATPLGNLAAGWAADRFGTTQTLLLMAVLCAAAGAWFLRRLPDVRAAIRPVYRRMGILPPVPAPAES